MKPGHHVTDIRRVSRAGRGSIVFITTWHPEPVDNGQKQRIRAMIDSLKGEYDVAVISLVPPEDAKRASFDIVPHVKQQWTLPLPVFQSRSPGAILAGVGLMPRSLLMTWSATTAEQINRIVHETNAEVVIGIDARTVRYLCHLGDGVRKILDSPELSFVLDKRRVSGNVLHRWRASAREFKYRQYFRGVSNKLDAILVPSEFEADAYRRLSGCGRVIVVENGVDTISTDTWVPPNTRQLVYAGSLTYEPNAEAVSYFVREVLPRIESRFPDVELAVTGILPGVVPKDAMHPKVRLTGRVESLRPVYQQSRLVTVPLLSGTGTRIKILEALAAGMPVVTTSKGSEGLDVVSGEHLIIADTAEDFAASIMRLLDDPDESVRLGRSGQALVERRYHWQSIGERLRDVVDGVIRNSEFVSAIH